MVNDNVLYCLTSRNGKNRTLGNENGSEGPKFSAFHPPVLPPEVIAGEVDVFPADGRQVLPKATISLRSEGRPPGPSN
jgi:hypothetical protein